MPLAADTMACAWPIVLLFSPVDLTPDTDQGEEGEVLADSNCCEVARESLVCRDSEAAMWLALAPAVTLGSTLAGERRAFSSQIRAVEFGLFPLRSEGLDPQLLLPPFKGVEHLPLHVYTDLSGRDLNCALSRGWCPFSVQLQRFCLFCRNCLRRL